MEAGEVTAADVERLWAAAIEQPGAVASRKQAETLLTWANAENPVVNEGLLTLHHLLGQDLPRDRQALVTERDRWRILLREFESDPVAWTTAYFSRMLHDFAGRHGQHRGEVFGEKLVREGHLTADDVRRVLRG